MYYRSDDSHYIKKENEPSKGLSKTRVCLARDFDIVTILIVRRCVLGVACRVSRLTSKELSMCIEISRPKIFYVLFMLYPLPIGRLSRTHLSVITIHRYVFDYIFFS